MAVTRGKDFYLYRNADSPYDNTPTWDQVVNVRDLTRNNTPALADASIRGSTFRMQVPTLLDMSIDFQMVYDPTDADQTAFENAYYTNGLIEILDLDGPITTVGSKGIRMHAQVSKYQVNEALEDVGLIDVSLVPGYAPTNLPRRVNVAVSGSVVDT
jgi:hypothetical protein